MAHRMPNWTPEEDEWLRECYPLYSNEALAEFKALDGWPRSAKSIFGRARALGLKKDPSRGYRKYQPARFWTEERLEWLREYVPGHVYQEIADEFERVFGIRLTMAQIHNAKVRANVKCGVNSGRFKKGIVPANKGKTWADIGISQEAMARCRTTQFKKGHKPHNSGELLDERLMGGFWQVKVDARSSKNTANYWIQRAQLNWMKANGRDWPEGHKALHVDRDPLNDDPDNIVPVPVEIWPLVMGAVKGQPEWHDRETLELAIAYAKVTVARCDVERRHRIAIGKPRKGDVSARGDAM